MWSSVVIAVHAHYHDALSCDLHTRFSAFFHVATVKAWKPEDEVGNTRAVVELVSPKCTSQTSPLENHPRHPTCSWWIDSWCLWYSLAEGCGYPQNAQSCLPCVQLSDCDERIHVHRHMHSQLLLLCFPNHCLVWVSWFAPYRPLALVSYTSMSKEHQRPLGGWASLNTSE